MPRVDRETEFRLRLLNSHTDEDAKQAALQGLTTDMKQILRFTSTHRNSSTLEADLRRAFRDLSHVIPSVLRGLKEACRPLDRKDDPYSRLPCTPILSILHLKVMIMEAEQRGAFRHPWGIFIKFVIELFGKYFNSQQEAVFHPRRPKSSCRMALSSPLSKPATGTLGLTLCSRAPT